MELGTFVVILTFLALNSSTVVSGLSAYSNLSENHDIEIYHNESSLQSHTQSFEEDQDMEDTYHWYPYQRIMYVLSKSGEIERFCKRPGSSIDEFPTFFTRNYKILKFDRSY